MSDPFVTPWTVAYQAPLSMGFPRQEYWSWLPFPSPGDLPDPGIEPTSALAGGFFGGSVVKNPPAEQEAWVQSPEERNPSPLQCSSLGDPSPLQCSSLGDPSPLQCSSLGDPSPLQCSSLGDPSPLQCSSLGNPRDRGAWQAAVHGATRVGHDLALNNNKSALYLVPGRFL